MNKFDYYLHDCILQGWRNVGWAFTAWKDFITSNYRNYDCFLDYTESDKEQSVRWDFWDALEDDIIDYESMSYLRSLTVDLNSIHTDEEWEKWKIKTGVVPMTKEWVDRIDELVGDVDVDPNGTLDVMFDDD